MTTAVPDPGEMERQLGALLDAVERGEVEATDAERAYLAGAYDVLARLSAFGPD